MTDAESGGDQDAAAPSLPSTTPSLFRGRGRAVALVLLAALGLFVCAYMSVPFVGALAWAVTLAILVWPVHGRVARSIRPPTAAALVSTLVVALVIAAPLAFVAQRLALEAAHSAAYLQSKVSTGEIGRLASPDSRIGSWLSGFTDKIDLPALAASLTGWLGSFVPRFLVGSSTQLLEIVLTFYFLFYLLRDRDFLLGAVRALLPLTSDEADHLLARASDTVQATVFGTVLVALIQGALGGLMFWILGLPAPMMWGLVMALLAIVPVLGAFVVWIPAAAFLILEGHVIKAVILAAWGAMVVGTIDNLLRPILVGDRLGLHTATAFIAMVGGVIWLGPPGFVLGPLAFTLTLSLLDILRARGVGNSRSKPTRMPSGAGPGTSSSGTEAKSWS